MGAGPDPRMVDIAQEAERWAMTPFYGGGLGFYVFTPLTWIGAHTKTIRLGTGVAQLSARARPDCSCINADHLSGGRVILGMGVSGPQVVEDGMERHSRSLYQEPGNTLIS